VLPPAPPPLLPFPFAPPEPGSLLDVEAPLGHPTAKIATETKRRLPRIGERDHGDRIAFL